MAWCQGKQNNLEHALSEYRLAYEERLVQQQYNDAAWNLGQMARHTIMQIGIEAAWALLDAELDKVQSESLIAIQQLGDAVADAVHHKGEADGFILCCGLLQGLAIRPQYSVEAALRALWIDMVDVGVPHGLLRDLLGEWPRLFGTELQALNQLLHDWLDDLDTPAAEREARRLTLDPDLATTLTALAEELPFATKRRLGLNQQKQT